jgi:hypothetical protein
MYHDVNETCLKCYTKVVVLDVFFTPDGSEVAWDGVHFTQ